MLSADSDHLNVFTESEFALSSFFHLVRRFNNVTSSKDRILGYLSLSDGMQKDISKSTSVRLFNISHIKLRVVDKIIHVLLVLYGSVDTVKVIEGGT